MPTASKPRAGLPPITELIDTHGELQARLILREYYRNPDHLTQFAELFPDYIPSELGQLHRELLHDYTHVDGNIGRAAPRGFSKSTVTDLVYLAWALLYCVEEFVVLVSDTFDQSVMLLEGLKAELEDNEMIRFIYGDVRGAQWSSEKLVVVGWATSKERREGQVQAKGAGNKIRGIRFRSSRPTLILIDDLENDEAVESERQRGKLKRWLIKGVLPALDKERGRIIIIGTLLHRDSLLSNIITGIDQFAGWNRRRYAAIKDDGTSLWPERFTVEWLKGQRDDPKHPMYLGPIGFAQEMMNNPIDDSEQIIKPAWLEKRYSLQRELQRFRRQFKHLTADEVLPAWLATYFKAVVTAIDPAISEKQTADYWASVTVGITRKCPFDGEAGHLVLLDVVRFRNSDPLVQAEEVVNGYFYWEPTAIKLEAVAYQKGLMALVKREAQKAGIVSIPLHPFVPDKDKRRRAILHSANFAGGLVHIRNDHPLTGAFVDEVLAFPQGTHDDMFDAFMSATEDTIRKVKRRTFSRKPAAFR